MYYKKIQDFLDDWEFEGKATQKVMDNLTDTALDQRVNPEGRTLGRLGWHIVETFGEMMERTGLKVYSPDLNNFNVHSAADIQQCYKNASDSLVEKLKSEWNDQTLEVEDNMYGSQWKRGATLASLIAHQTHHRAQMTVLMRQAGLKVPGIYGPSREEWAAMGMEPQA